MRTTAYGGKADAHVAVSPNGARHLTLGSNLPLLWES
jgi:hypothetical protein